MNFPQYFYQAMWAIYNELGGMGVDQVLILVGMSVLTLSACLVVFKWAKAAFFG